MTYRYVTGLGVDTDGPVGYLVRLEEDDDGNRLGQAVLATDMTVEQVDHLYLQVGNLLAVMKPKEKSNA